MENTETRQHKKNESKKNWPFVFLFIVLIAADQLFKYLAGKIFRNYAFAFSLPVPGVLIYVIYALVMAVMVYYAAKNYKNFSTFVTIAWTLIFAGAVSNILERIILGYVRDFIYISLYRWTGIYNLADFFIIGGIILLLIPQAKSDI